MILKFVYHATASCLESQTMEHAIKQQDSVNASKMSQVGSVMDVQILSGVFVYLLLGTVENAAVTVMVRGMEA